MAGHISRRGLLAGSGALTGATIAGLPVTAETSPSSNISPTLVYDRYVGGGIATLDVDWRPLEVRRRFLFAREQASLISELGYGALVWIERLKMNCSAPITEWHNARIVKALPATSPEARLARLTADLDAFAGAEWMTGKIRLKPSFSNHHVLHIENDSGAADRRVVRVADGVRGKLGPAYLRQEYCVGTSWDGYLMCAARPAPEVVVMG